MPPMMNQGGRYSLLVAGDGQPVSNGIGTHENLVALLRDREANGEALPRERVVRLPRRLCRQRPWERWQEVVDRLVRWANGNLF